MSIQKKRLIKFCIVVALTMVGAIYLVWMVIDKPYYPFIVLCLCCVSYALINITERLEDMFYYLNIKDCIQRLYRYHYFDNIERCLNWAAALYLVCVVSIVAIAFCVLTSDLAWIFGSIITVAVILQIVLVIWAAIRIKGLKKKIRKEAQYKPVTAKEALKYYD